MQRTNEWAPRVGRRSGMNWEESGTDIYALRSIKQITNEIPVKPRSPLSALL